MMLQISRSAHDIKCIREIKAHLADIIPADVAHIIAEYSLRSACQKLTHVLHNEASQKILRFDTSQFPIGTITKFEVRILNWWAFEYEDMRYIIVISGPGGELGCKCGFEDLYPNSSYWTKHSSSELWKIAAREYQRQMSELMSRY